MNNDKLDWLRQRLAYFEAELEVCNYDDEDMIQLLYARIEEFEEEIAKEESKVERQGKA